MLYHTNIIFTMTKQRCIYSVATVHFASILKVVYSRDGIQMDWLIGMNSPYLEPNEASIERFMP